MVDYSNFVPLIMVVIEFSIPFVFFPKIIKWVFKRFSDRRFVWSHEVSKGMSSFIFLSRSGRVLPSMIRFESSAKSMVLKFVKIFPRSFILLMLYLT